jgi:hypothetical protein
MEDEIGGVDGTVFRWSAPAAQLQTAASLALVRLTLTRQPPAARSLTSRPPTLHN